MKAYGYSEAHNLDQFSIEPMDVATPILGELDILIRVKAIALNPVDYKIRQTA